MKTKNNFFAILISILIASISFSYGQVPEIEWEKSYGGTDDDYAKDIIQTSDGGYIIVGQSRSKDGDVSEVKCTTKINWDYWIVKIDENGEIEWEKSYGGSNNDYAKDIIQTSDGGYIIAGYSWSIDGDISEVKWDTSFIKINPDYWIVKIDENGEIEWEKSYGGTDYDYANKIIQTSDGGYIIAGYSWSTYGDIFNPKCTTRTNSDYWIVKIDENGEIEWEKSYGGTDDDYAKDIIQTSDGGYIIAGDTRSQDGDVSKAIWTTKTDWDYWIIKIDENGEIEWEKSYGGWSYDELESIIQTSDGGYIIAGSSLSNEKGTGYYEFFIVKIDENGEIEWEKYYYGWNDISKAKDIIQTSDGGYIVAGVSFIAKATSAYDNYIYWIVKIDENGEIEWEKSYGGTDHDYANKIIQTSDGGYIIAGSSNSTDGDITNPKGGFDYWIIKICYSDSTTTDSTTTDSTTTSNAGLKPVYMEKFQAFPNPTTNNITLTNLPNNSQIQLMDIFGNILEIKITQTSNTSDTISLQKYPKGVYFLKIISSDATIQNKKIIKN